jgi:hypothetical protein
MTLPSPAASRPNPSRLVSSLRSLPLARKI